MGRKLINEERCIDFIKLEIIEINSTIKTKLDILYKWYTFYITVNVVCIGTIILKIPDIENDSVEILLKAILIVIIAFTVSAYFSFIFLYTQYKNFSCLLSRLKEIKLILNTTFLRGQSQYLFKPIFEKSFTNHEVLLMITSITSIALSWSVLLFYYINKYYPKFYKLF